VNACWLGMGMFEGVRLASTGSFQLNRVRWRWRGQWRRRHRCGTGRPASRRTAGLVRRSTAVSNRMLVSVYRSSRICGVGGDARFDRALSLFDVQPARRAVDESAGS
jgi:hypothetical protein